MRHVNPFASYLQNISTGLFFFLLFFAILFLNYFIFSPITIELYWSKLLWHEKHLLSLHWWKQTGRDPFLSHQRKQ